MKELLPFLVIIVAFWFLLIRPQQKRAREAREMQNTVEVGTKILLTSGVYGEIAGVTDDYILVRIADGVEIKIVRNAIGRVLPPEAAPFEETSTSPTDGIDEDSQPEYTEPTEAAGTVDLDKPSTPETPEETLERLRKQGENH